MLCRIGVTVWAMCCKDRPVSSLSALQSYFQHKEEKGKTEEKCELCKKVCKVQSKQKADKKFKYKRSGTVCIPLGESNIGYESSNRG